jgi:hypothetical protein
MVLTACGIWRSGTEQIHCSKTAAIRITEIVDNAIMVLIPGAMEASLDDIGF